MNIKILQYEKFKKLFKYILLKQKKIHIGIKQKYDNFTLNKTCDIVMIL